MDDNILSLMLFGSLILGGLGVTGFIWGLKSGQFDDEKKFTQGLLFDDEEELREAARRDAKEKEAKEEKEPQHNEEARS